MRRLAILVVDDEANMVKFVASNLRAAGYEVATASDGDTALSTAQDQSPDLIILDLMLPDIDGFEVCRRLRAFTEAPVIILSAKGDSTDKVAALNLGADDYLTKPFGVDELLARVRAVLRRTQRDVMEKGSRILVRGSFALDPASREVSVYGRQVKLTPTEFELLHYLMRNAGRVVPHKMLLSEIWGPEYRNQTEYIHVYVGRLRQKTEPDLSRPRHLITQPGIGYLFRS